MKSARSKSAGLAREQNPEAQKITQYTNRDMGTEMLQGAYDRCVRAAEFKAQVSPVKQLVKDGYWAVPEADRPAGWEKRGIPE